MACKYSNKVSLNTPVIWPVNAIVTILYFGEVTILGNLSTKIYHSSIIDNYTK